MLPQSDHEGEPQIRRKPAGMKQALQSGADIPANESERVDTINDSFRLTEQTKVIIPREISVVMVTLQSHAV